MSTVTLYMKSGNKIKLKHIKKLEIKSTGMVRSLTIELS